MKFEWLFSVLMVASHGVVAAESLGQPWQCGVVESVQISKSLGISKSFGKWPQGKVPIAYNPAGAPVSYRDNNKVIAAIKAAFTQWTAVSDVQFEFKGLSNHDINNSDDNLVIIGWEASSDSYAGLAGPSTANATYFSDLLAAGYAVYTDGTLRLNSLVFEENSATVMVDVVAHELGHILGFGHSDNPDSILYANPYSAATKSVVADDISAAQSVYGPPDVLSYEDKRYSPPQQSYFPSPKAVAFVKRAAGGSSLSDLTQVDASTPDDSAIFGKVSYSNLGVGTVVELVTVAPNGSEVSRDEEIIQFVNGTFYPYLVSIRAFKARPGIWKQYGLIDHKLYFTLSLKVDVPSIVWNKSPEAKVNIQQLSMGLFKVSVQASDPENDAITVTWHAPEQRVVSEVVNQGLLEKSFNYPALGAYDLYVALTDNSPRYSGSVSGSSSAGLGFRRIINKQLLVSPSANSSTYFAGKGILHIPVLNIPGQGLFAAVLKITALQGTVLKLLELTKLPDQQALKDQAVSYQPNSGTLTIPAVDVVSAAGAVTGYKNAVLKVLVNSDPLKIVLMSIE